MDKFKHIISKVIPLDRSNVDTDAIIPKQFLKSIKRTGFGPNLFDEWRYLDHGEPGMDNSKRSINPDFVLNKPQFKDSKFYWLEKILGAGLAEHAPWALLDFGIKVLSQKVLLTFFTATVLKMVFFPITLQRMKLKSYFLKLRPKLLKLKLI